MRAKQTHQSHLVHPRPVPDNQDQAKGLGGACQGESAHVVGYLWLCPCAEHRMRHSESSDQGKGRG